MADHSEQQLLAYVFGKFGEYGLLGMKTEAEKMMMLAALNLVECIAETAPGRRAKTADLAVSLLEWACLPQHDGCGNDGSGLPLTERRHGNRPTGVAERLQRSTAVVE